MFFVPRKMCKFPFRIILFCLNTAVMIACFALMVIGGMLAWGTSFIISQLDKFVEPLKKTLGVDAADVTKNAVEMLLPITRPVGIVLFICGLGILMVAVFGCVGATCNRKLCLRIYIGLLMFFVVSHLVLLITYFLKTRLIANLITKQLEEPVKNYVSIKSQQTESIFISLIMGIFQCCGYNNGEDFKNSKMESSDAWMGQVYTDLKYPMFCCKMTTEFNFEYPDCPRSFEKHQSNINRGCGPEAEKRMLGLFNKLIYSSLLILIFNIVIIIIALLAL